MPYSLSFLVILPKAGKQQSTNLRLFFFGVWRQEFARSEMFRFILSSHLEITTVILIMTT